jgi:hypothetical protein
MLIPLVLSELCPGKEKRTDGQSIKTNYQAHNYSTRNNISTCNQLTGVFSIQVNFYEINHLNGLKLQHVKPSKNFT